MPDASLLLICLRGVNMAIADRYGLAYRFACTRVIHKPRTESQLWDVHAVRKCIGFVENHRSTSIIVVSSARGGAALVVRVSDLFQPLDGLAIERLLDGNMRHSRGGRCAVPMLLTRREPNHVARSNFLNRSAFPLGPAAACRYDQGLPQRVCMPGRAS